MILFIEEVFNYFFNHDPKSTYDFTVNHKFWGFFCLFFNLRIPSFYLPFWQFARYKILGWWCFFFFFNLSGLWICHPFLCLLASTVSSKKTAVNLTKILLQSESFFSCCFQSFLMCLGVYAFWLGYLGVYRVFLDVETVFHQTWDIFNIISSNISSSSSLSLSS